jgi:hypothetical protein
MTETIPADGFIRCNQTGSVTVLQMTMSADGSTRATRNPQRRSSATFIGMWLVWSKPETRMWRMPSRISVSANPGQLRETKVTVCPEAANILAKMNHAFSVAPPFRGGTGRKNPVTIVIRNVVGRMNQSLSSSQ